jgi:hypothetical protein
LNEKLSVDDVVAVHEEIQEQAISTLIAKHFRRGKDPPPVTFSRGTITIENMLSKKFKKVDDVAVLN